MSARQHFSFKMFLQGKKGLNAFLPGASLTPGSVGVGTIRASAFMHFLGTEVQGRQLVFLPGLRFGEHSHPGLIPVDCGRSIRNLELGWFNQRSGGDGVDLEVVYYEQLATFSSARKVGFNQRSSRR